MNVLLGLPLILACMLGVPAAYAQEMPPAEQAEKEYRNMDSRLADLHDAAAAGDVSRAFDALPLSSGGQRVQVVLEMAGTGVPVPPGLGIEVETTYENLVQATVPVRNLEAIASDENVGFVRLPSTPVHAIVQPLSDGDAPGGPGPLYLVAIPAAALSAAVIVFVWQKNVSRK